MIVNGSDFLQILSKLTLKRVINAFQIVSSYLYSRGIGKSNISGMPISLAIEPTTACNLRCPECPSGLRSFTRPTGSLKMDAYEKMIDELAPTTSYLTFYFQGEPYLNKDFLKMVAYADKHKVYTATSTNAHFLDDQSAQETIDAGLNRLIISIDGADQEHYESYRKEGNLDKVLAGTKNILKWRAIKKSKTPAVIWQFLVVGPNEHQIPEMKRLAKEYRVDKLVLKTAQIYDYEDGNDLIPSQDQYSRYELLPSGKYSIKSKLLDHCWKMWSSCVVTWDGKVIPCCFDKDAHYELGNVTQKTFKEVWSSPKYKNFRSTLIKGRSQIEMCQNCTEGTKVWA